MKKQIQRIKTKLEELKILDKEFKVFGAESHKYALNAPLTIKEVRAFEGKHQVTLPKEYVAFITQMGNGGAGPYYGVQTLENALNESLVYPDSDSHNILSKPFPHTEAWACFDELDEIYERMEAAQEAGNIALEEAAFEEKYDLIGGPEHNYGILNVCHFGCGIMMFLVVTGEERGNMWTDDRMNDSGIFPFEEMKVVERITFLDWYECWLNQNLLELKIT